MLVSCRKPPRLQDFRCLAVLGRGHFGKVGGVRRVLWKGVSGPQHLSWWGDAVTHGAVGGGRKDSPALSTWNPSSLWFPGPPGPVQGDREILCHQSAEEARGAEPGRDGEVCSQDSGPLALEGTLDGWPGQLSAPGTLKR